MATLSPTQATTWRLHPQVSDAILWIDQSPVVVAAQINTLDETTSVVASLHNVTSGSIAAAVPGQLITFGSVSGADDLGRLIVFSVASPVITCARASDGTQDGAVNIAAGSYITVYDLFPPFALIPYIDPNGVSYKNGILDFASYGLHPPPVANINAGCGYLDIVDDTTHVITLAFLDASGSFTTDPTSGGTFSVLWGVGDGTITVGSTTTNAITATFPVGRRYITCTVTDLTNGTSTTRRLLVVACKYGDANYAPITNFTVDTPLSQKVEGLSVSFKVYQSIPAASYPDNMMVLYSRTDYYNGTAATLNSRVTKFCGWHLTDPTAVTAQDKALLTETTLDCVDTLGRFATLPGFPQTLENVNPPTAWEQFANPNLDDFLIYLWLWHGTGPTIADFTPSGTSATYPFTRLNSGSGTLSLYAQMDGRARAIGYRFTSNAFGQCIVKQDPLLFASADRPSSYTISFLQSDWTALSYPHQRPSKSHWMRGNAIVADPLTVSALFCIAPGNTPSQGVSESTYGSNLAVDQNELNVRTGNAYARENSNYGLWQVKLTSQGDASFQPLDYVELTQDAVTAAQRGLTFTAQRFLVTQVDTPLDNEFGTSTPVLTLEWETFGQPATTVIPPTASNVQPSVTFQSPFLPPLVNIPASDGTSAGQLIGVVATLGLISDDGNIYQGASFNTPSPLYAQKSMGVSGTPICGVGDPFSPRYLGGVPGSEVDAWIVTTTGIYFVTNMQGTPSASLQKSFRATRSLRSIQMQFATQFLISVWSDYSDGTYETHSTDGATWSTETLIGSATAGTYAPGAAVSSRNIGTIYGSAIHTGVGAGYGSVNSGASYALLSNPAINPGSDLCGDIHLPYNSNGSDKIAYYGKSMGTPVIKSVAANVDVPGNNTGISITAGQYVVITASGTWKNGTLPTCGPNGDGSGSCASCVLTTASASCLIGQIGTGGPLFFIGTGISFVAGASGTLYLLMNDHTGVYGDNTGALTATISVGSTARHLMRVNGTTVADVSPVVSGTPYGPWQFRQVDSCAVRAAYMVAALGNNNQSLAGVWTSNNGGASWYNLVPPSSAANRYERCAISGSIPVVVYCFGKQGRIGISTSGVSVVEKAGNIASFSPGAIIQAIGL